MTMTQRTVDRGRVFQRTAGLARQSRAQKHLFVVVGLPQTRPEIVSFAPIQDRGYLKVLRDYQAKIGAPVSDPTSRVTGQVPF